MSTVVITDEFGTREINCAPMEEYERGLEADIVARRFSDISRILKLKTMSREQLQHLASILTSMVLYYARLYDASFSSEHAKTVQGLREIKRAADEAGVELWKDWPEL